VHHAKHPFVGVIVELGIMVRTHVGTVLIGIARLDMSDIEIAIEVRARTPKALLVFDGKIECWIPRSQITDYSGDEDSPDTIFISEWLAGEKGLI